MTDAESREGPTITIVARCGGCRWCHSESYRVQGDSGHDVYCMHPTHEPRKSVGDTRWNTPDWCPVKDIPAVRTLLTEGEGK